MEKSLEFTETMRGFFTAEDLKSDVKSDLYQESYKAGEAAKRQLDFTLTIKVADIDAFYNDPELTAEATGVINCPELGGELKVEKGVFNLFVSPQASKDYNTAKEMHYLLYFKDKDGQDLTFYGFKAVEREDATDAWDETTTLYTSIWKGHKPFETDDREIIAVGILRIILSDFIQQMKSFKVSGNYLEKVRSLGKFMTLFAGELWDAYAPFVFGTDKDRWNEHVLPLQTMEGVTAAEKEIVPFNTEDGLALSFSRFKRSDSKDIVLMLHGLTTSTDMYIMPEHYNLTEYLLDKGIGDVWSLDWRGSGRFTYNLQPHRYSLDHIAKYDVPAAIAKIREIKGDDVNIHVVCHCVGSIGFMTSLASGQISGIKSVISNSVSLHPRVPWQSNLKLKFAPFIVEYLLGYPYLSPMMAFFPGPGFGRWLWWMERSIRHECKEPACHMVSFMWGWGFPAAYEHRNIHPVTHRRLKDLFGGTSMNMQRHIRKMVKAGEAVSYKKEGAFYDLPESYLESVKSVDLPPTLLISGDKNHIFPASNKLSYERLKAMGKDVQYREFKDYGHQDTLMGRYCDREVFPHLWDFLSKHIEA